MERLHIQSELTFLGDPPSDALREQLQANVSKAINEALRGCGCPMLRGEFVGVRDVERADIGA
jgi:hypothetical protein